MLLDIADVMREGVKDWHETMEFPRIVAENVEVVSMSPVDVKVHAVADTAVCQTDNDLKTVVTYVCSRCLEHFEEELSTHFQELFSQKSVSNEEIHVIPDSVVEFDPYVEQAINLVLNPKPVCSSDCRGLCAQCGTNLNESQCNCENKVVDPRLEVLKGLLSEEESE